jgi:hypothetical protein
VCVSVCVSVWVCEWVGVCVCVCFFRFVDAPDRNRDIDCATRQLQPHVLCFVFCGFGCARANKVSFPPENVSCQNETSLVWKRDIKTRHLVWRQKYPKMKN